MLKSRMKLDPAKGVKFQFSWDNDGLGDDGLRDNDMDDLGDLELNCASQVAILFETRLREKVEVIINLNIYSISITHPSFFNTQNKGISCTQNKLT